MSKQVYNGTAISFSDRSWHQYSGHDSRLVDVLGFGMLFVMFVVAPVIGLLVHGELGGFLLPLAAFMCRPRNVTKRSQSLTT